MKRLHFGQKIWVTCKTEVKAVLPSQFCLILIRGEQARRLAVCVTCCVCECRGRWQSSSFSPSLPICVFISQEKVTVERAKTTYHTRTKIFSFLLVRNIFVTHRPNCHGVWRKKAWPKRAVHGFPVIWEESGRKGTQRDHCIQNNLGRKLGVLGMFELFPWSPTTTNEPRRPWRAWRKFIYKTGNEWLIFDTYRIPH